MTQNMVAMVTTMTVTAVTSAPILVNFFDHTLSWVSSSTKVSLKFFMMPPFFCFDIRF